MATSWKCDHGNENRQVLKTETGGKYPSCTDPYKMGMEWKSHYMGMGWRSAYCYIWEASSFYTTQCIVWNLISWLLSFPRERLGKEGTRNCWKAVGRDSLLRCDITSKHTVAITQGSYVNCKTTGSLIITTHTCDKIVVNYHHVLCQLLQSWLS